MDFSIFFHHSSQAVGVVGWWEVGGGGWGAMTYLMHGEVLLGRIKVRVKVRRLDLDLSLCLQLLFCFMLLLSSLPGPLPAFLCRGSSHGLHRRGGHLPCLEPCVSCLSEAPIGGRRGGGAAVQTQVSGGGHWVLTVPALVHRGRDRLVHRARDPRV